MVLRRVFKEPNLTSLIGATFLALFQVVNSAGYSDNLAMKVGIINETPEAGEKIVIPSGLSTDFWGKLEIGILDQAIVLFLCYTMVAMWVHKPREGILADVSGSKIVAIKSRGWVRVGIFSLVLGLLSTANKNGNFASIFGNISGSGETTVGRFGRHDGSWSFEPSDWGILDFVELFALYSFFVLAIWMGIEVDRAKLNPLPDNRNYIERIWGGIRDAEREQRSDVESGAKKANEAFTSLVKMLSAAASLNVAASSLDEGNVKGAFNKWKNLTHRKGKQNESWKGLSESLDQAGSFTHEEEE